MNIGPGGYGVNMDAVEAVIYKRERDVALAQLNDLWRKIHMQNHEIEQVLGQALGNYPWYKDDPKNFPGATEYDGVCVGEHVPETLAAEAADEIRRLRSILREIADLAHPERER